MKKAICLILSLCLVLGGIKCLAEEIPEEILVFEGIAWSVDDEGTLRIAEGTVNYVINSSWGYYSPWRYNEHIKKVIIPDNVEYIGERIFEGCINIEEVILPKSLRYLHEDAFYYCNKIKYITISEDNLMYKSVDGVLFDDKGKRLFMYGKGRDDVCYTIPHGTEEIIESAFENHLALETVTFPDTLKTIKPKAFKGCTSLKEVDFPDSLTYIGKEAFENCESLESIKMPQYAYLQNNPFYNTAFYNNQANWDRDALYINKHLLSVKAECEIKNDTVSVAGEAFANRNDIKKVTIPSSVKSIGDKAFASSEGIEEVVFEEGLEILGHNCFEYSSVKSVKLPLSLQIIGGEAFMHSGIKGITIPDNVIDIGDRVFEGCYDLESVTLGKNLGHIGSGAFRTCHMLKSITIPDSVWKIENYAFSYCSKLEKVTIGSGISEIDKSVFLLCSSLETIEISSKNPYLSVKDNVVFNKPGEKLIYYPDGKKDKEYTIPHGVTTIGEKSVDDANFEALIIPATVKAIKEGNNPSYLKDIYYQGTEDQWEKIAIDKYNYTINNAIIHFENGDTKNIYSDLRYREEDGVIYITHLANDDVTAVSIPGTIDGKRVEIASGAFRGSSLEKVTLDKEIKTIPYQAFMGCSKLETINLDYVEHIEGQAFQGCESLKDINLLSIKTWDGIDEDRINTIAMKLELIPYKYMIGYDATSFYTIFYDAKIENLKIRWPKENFSEGDETFPGLFLGCEIENVYFENFTLSPSLAEFYGIDPSGRIKSVDPYVNLVKPNEGMVIYGNSEEVKNYADEIGVKYVKIEK